MDYNWDVLRALEGMHVVLPSSAQEYDDLVMWCQEKVNAILDDTRTPVYKIGITGNPEVRFRHYKEEEGMKCMYVLFGSELRCIIESLETDLISFL